MNPKKSSALYELAEQPYTKNILYGLQFTKVKIVFNLQCLMSRLSIVRVEILTLNLLISRYVPKQVRLTKHLQSATAPTRTLPLTPLEIPNHFSKTASSWM